MPEVSPRGPIGPDPPAGPGGPWEPGGPCVPLSPVRGERGGGNVRAQREVD